MPKTKAPPEIFDRSLLRTRRARAARRGPSFLMERCASDAADRLCDINRQFKRALIIAPEDFVVPFLNSLPDDKRPQTVQTLYACGAALGLDHMTTRDDLPFKVGHFDLIISILDLHSTNDLPGALMALRHGLKPDGLLIASMFGGNTLTELRQVLYAADEAMLGGISARISPFGDYSQMAALLQRAGLALPVVDRDRVNVTYREFLTLIGDIRDMGDMNCLTSRQSRFVGKSYLKAAEQLYAKQFSRDDKFAATFEILWLTGWSPHESQQKPLKPGSAKMRLADALGAIEKKAEP